MFPARPSCPDLRARFLFPFLLLLLVVLPAGCGDSTTGPPDVDLTEVGVVVNSVELTLTVFELDDPDRTRTIPLGPDGTPVGAAVRGNLAVVPMGTLPAAVVVDLAEGAVVRSVALPEGSGATGTAFVNDSVALVANPGRDTVSPVNVLRGTAAPEIPVGGFPNGVIAVGDRIFVVNGELEDFTPVREGTLTVLDRGSLEVLATVELSGLNPGPAAVGPGGLLYVVNGGSFGEGNGSLSVVDPGAAVETAHHPGFGDFPASVAVGGDGRIYLSSWSYGIAAWDPVSASFHRSPENAIEPEGVPSSAGVAADPEGRIYSLFPECMEPSRVLRLGPGYETERTVEVGVCPAALLFTVLEGVDAL